MLSLFTYAGESQVKIFVSFSLHKYTSCSWWVMRDYGIILFDPLSLLPERKAFLSDALDEQAPRAIIALT